MPISGWTGVRTGETRANHQIGGSRAKEPQKATFDCRWQDATILTYERSIKSGSIFHKSEGCFSIFAVTRYLGKFGMRNYCVIFSVFEPFFSF